MYEAVLNNIKPGITSQQVLQAALPTMDKVLASIKFSKPLYANAAKAFVERYRTSATAPGGRGGLGHAVGMATHDFGGGTGMMRPGMVFTIEPEFRIPEEDLHPPRGHDRHHADEGRHHLGLRAAEYRGSREDDRRARVASAVRTNQIEVRSWTDRI